MREIEMLICKKCFMHYYVGEHPKDAKENENFFKCPDKNEHEFVKINAEMAPLFIELEKKGYSVGKMSYPRYISSVKYFRKYTIPNTYMEDDRELYATENDNNLAIEITHVADKPATEVIDIGVLRKSMLFAFECIELGTSVVIKTQYVNYDCESDAFTGIHNQMIKFMRLILGLKDYIHIDDENN